MLRTLIKKTILSAVDWDKVGIFISSLCMVHCLLTPLLVFSFPVLAMSFHAPWFHWLIALIVVPVGVIAFIRGYLKHRNLWVPILGCLGLMIVMFALFIPHEVLHLIGHIQTTLIGSILLLTAHVVNQYSCRCGHHHH